MFNQNVAIVVDDVTYNYGLTSIVDGKSIRNNASASIGAPDSFTISHETKGKGSSAVDRHLVRLDTTYEATDAQGSLSQATATAYVVLVAPHNAVTQANMQLAYDKIVAFLGATESGASNSNLVRILNNEP